MQFTGYIAYSQGLSYHALHKWLSSLQLIKRVKARNIDSIGRPNYKFDSKLRFRRGFDCRVMQCASCKATRLGANSRHRFVLDHSVAPVGPLSFECKPKL